MDKISIIFHISKNDNSIESLKTIINQTYKNIEILVLLENNNIYKYIETDNRIKLVNKNNIDSNITGNLIVNCNSNNLYNKNFIKNIYNNFNNNNLIILNCKKSIEDILQNNINDIHILIEKNIILNIIESNFKDYKTYIITDTIILFTIVSLYTKNINYYNKILFNNKNNIIYKDISTIEDKINILSQLKNIIKEEDYDYFYYITNILYNKLIIENGYINKKKKNNITVMWIEKLGILSISEKNYHNDLIKMDLSNINFNSKRTENKPIKTIAFIYHRLFDGGIEKMISNLSFIFYNEGYKIIIFTDSDENQNDYAIPNDTIRVKIPDNNIDKFKTFKENIEKYDIDVVLYNKWLSREITIDALMIKQLNTKFITIIHGNYLVFNYLNIPQFFYYGNTLKLSDYVITLSNKDKNFYESLGINNVYYIPNPSNYNNEQVSNLDTKNIVWLARFEINIKRPHLAIKAFSKVVEKIPDAQLFIIGTGSDSDIEFINKNIKFFKVENNCHLVGFDLETKKYFLNSSIHLVTSVSEGFSMVILESKSYGVPTVMFDLPYLEVVKDNKGVLKAEEGDIDGLAELMITILENEEYRKKLGKEAKDSLKKFNNDNILKLWKNLFNDIYQNNETTSKELEENTITYELMNVIKEYDNMNKYLLDKIFNYHFSIIKNNYRIFIKLLFIKITIKSSKYYDKIEIITFSSLLKKIFHKK